MENNFKEAFSQFKTELKEIFSPKEEVIEVKLGSVKVQDGSIDIMFDGEALEVGAAVWVMGEGEDRIALEAGELPLEDGRVLVIGDDSIVAEIKDASAEAPAEEELNAETTTPSIPNSEAVGAIKQLIVKYSEQWDEKFKSLEDSLMEFKKRE